MSITNIVKQYLLQWKNWNTQWVNNTDRTWRELGGNAISNSSKVSIGETWSTISTTWGAETRTWQAVSQLIDNINKVPSELLWSADRTPWTDPEIWSVEGGITNIAKPV